MSDFRVTEIFYSIQGEGPSMGEPSVFIRFTNCNLTCYWCDSWKTWRFDGVKTAHRGGKDTVADYEKDSIDMSYEEIIDKVKRLTASVFDPINVIFTGGEPLYWMPKLPKLINELREKTWCKKVEIETNGTIKPIQELIVLVNRFNVSPKLSNSGMTEKVRIKPKALEELASTYKSIFKFVVCRPEDVSEVELLRQEIGIESNRIYLMPEAVTEIELQERSRLVVEWCKKTGFNYSSRLQVAIWGEVMGV